ncbi:hypothetical protein ON010_g15042 [Phytophthora cinnamomi]|nr:hypothetical protein ON010_g15042 [Phytophthora cinnamomi]
MSTTADSKVSKTSEAKAEISLLRSLRVAGLAEEVVPEAVGTPKTPSATSRVLEPSVDSNLPPASESDPSSGAEVPPKLGNSESPPGFPVKKYEGEPSDDPNPRFVGEEQPDGCDSRISVSECPPEPTAADTRSSQVEGGALSVLGKRELQMKVHSAPGTGTNPVRLGYAPGVLPPGHRLRDVPEGGETKMTLAQLPDMTDGEMVSYGRSQFERWMSVPPDMVLPVDIAYTPRHGGYDFCVRSPSCEGVAQADAAGDNWNIGSRIRSEIERIGNFIGIELAAWNAAVGFTPYFVRQVTDPLLVAPATTAIDGDGDTLMDEDTQLFLEPEVVTRLHLIGRRPRSPASSVEGGPIRKRSQLLRSESGISIPNWHGSSDASGNTLSGIRGPVPSVVGVNNGFDASMRLLEPACHIQRAIPEYFVEIIE